MTILEKAIRYYKAVRDDAKAVLDSGFGKQDGESDTTYKNRQMYAEFAIDAIEKQIPKNPIRDSLADRGCPRCNSYIPFDALNDRIEDAPDFCKHCGQALDWGDSSQPPKGE